MKIFRLEAPCCAETTENDKRISKGKCQWIASCLLLLLFLRVMVINLSLPTSFSLPSIFLRNVSHQLYPVAPQYWVVIPELSLSTFKHLLKTRLFQHMWTIFRRRCDWTASSAPHTNIRTQLNSIRLHFCQLYYLLCYARTMHCLIIFIIIMNEYD